MKIFPLVRCLPKIKKRYVYDLHGNLCKEIRGAEMDTGESDEERIGTLYTYNYAGRLMEKRTSLRREGKQTFYGLDHWGRIVDLEKADGSHEYYGYDYAGNRILATDGKGHTTTWHYNRINRPAVMTDAEGKQETYAY